MSTTPPRRGHALRLLALLFLAPLLLAFWLYYGLGWRPAGSTNHGELISPPVELVALAPPGSAAAGVFPDRWSLVYVGDGRCDDACRGALLQMQQVYLSLGRLATRVQQVFLVNGNCCDRPYLEHEHSLLRLIDASAPAEAPLLDAFGHTAIESSVFVVDPLGNLMLRYDTHAGPRGLRQDLQRLLNLSHIG
jgi:hypothetical protein